MDKTNESPRGNTEAGVLRSSDEKPSLRGRRARAVTDVQLEKFLDEIQSNLDNGLLSDAESAVLTFLESHALQADLEARVKTFLSLAREMLSRYTDALEILNEYDNEEILSRLSPHSAVIVLTQLGNCYGNLNDYPKSIGLLNSALLRATQGFVEDVLAGIYVGLSRVYRKMGEFPIAADHGEKALRSARQTGNWRFIYQAYQARGTAQQFEGKMERAIDSFSQANEILGDREAAFLRARIFADMGSAYTSWERPRESVACLEKAIALLERAQSKVNLMICYNNLGMNLLRLGEGARAEQSIERAKDLAEETGHLSYAAILDSLAEIKLFRGLFDEALELLNKAIEIGNELNIGWGLIQAKRNIARCMLAKGNFDEALRFAKETIEQSARMGENAYLAFAKLIEAEAHLRLGNSKDFEKTIASIENENSSADYFVLGQIQRLHGLASSLSGNEEIALYHFNRAVTTFETANDFYHSALTHTEIGKLLTESQPMVASRHFSAALDVFRRLDSPTQIRAIEEHVRKIETVKPSPAKTHSVSSQLLMLRLAEAVASRELLMRELVAVLQQESTARKIIVAELNEQKRFYPIITQGYSARESVELVSKIHDAYTQEVLEDFCKTKDLSATILRSPNTPPAMVVIAPRSGAILRNGSSIEPLLRVVQLGMDVCTLRDKDRGRNHEDEPSTFLSSSLLPGFIHSSPAMTALVEEVYKIRSSDVTVLVTGESGTGKELVSRAIHTLSNRKDKIFVPFNCTAVPKELAEGTLFGYRKGSFTGAVNDSVGVIRNADGGTLFLDEVGDLPIDVQPKLLRFLQEGEVQTLGEKHPTKVDVRVIAATNMHLEEKVQQGQFREDLYYRLNVIRLHVPPLRERRSEIPAIVNYYMNHYGAKFGRRDLTITPQAVDLLMVCDWEGNVRELCNEVQRFVARAHDGEVITPASLSPELRRAASASPTQYASNVRPIHSVSSFFGTDVTGGTLEEAVSALEARMISEALQRHKGNISRVARELGLTRRGLYLKISRYQLDKTGT